MVGRFFRYLGREVGGLHEAAYLLAAFTLLSQVLAVVRDRYFASEFGAGSILDVYYAAFRIPDIIFVSVGSVVSISILIPLLVEASGRGEAEERAFIDTLFSFFFALIAGVSFVAFLLAPAIINAVFGPLVAAGHGPELILSTRIMLLSPILLGLSNYLASIMQVRKRFIAYAIAPVFYNLGIVIGAVFLYAPFGQAGLAMGVVLGALMHFLLQTPYLLRRRLMPRFRTVDWGVVRRVASLSVYRTLALSSTHIALIALTSFASALAVGSIAVFNFAWNLQSVPLAIVGASYSMALFPAISKLFADKDREGFIRQTAAAARHIVFWSLPVMALFIVLRAQIIRTILGAGAFSWSDTRLTAAALAIFTVSILAQSLSLIFVRAYYAAGNTRTPLTINLITSACIILFAAGAMALMAASPLLRDFLEALLRVDGIGGTAVLALPLGYSLALLLNLVAFAWRFECDFPGFLKPVRETFFQGFSASVLGGAAAYSALDVLDDLFDLTTGTGIFLQGLLAGIVGLAAIIAVLRLLRSEELREVWKALHQKIWRTKVIVAEQESL